MPFSVTTIDLGDNNKLFIIDIETISSSLKDAIDEKFVKICEGNSGTDLALVKQRLINFLTTKRGSTLEIGAIAEFFLHLFLNKSGFEPQFLYFNLEEGSIKKGFDGYYLFDGAEWMLESKAGSITTAGISHQKKVKEAYEDLSNKIAGNVTNNPWQNAYSHASQFDVAAEANVRENIKKFSVDFQKGIFHNISDFNIIPGSTIVLNDVWEESNVNELETDIQGLISTLPFKQINVVCVTKKSLKLFWDYLNMP